MKKIFMKRILLLPIIIIAITSCKKLDGPKAQKAVDSLKVGLVAYYTLNNTVADSSGNHFDGVAYNLTSTTDRFGKSGGAYYFNGINSYITVLDTPALRLNNIDFSLNSWVKIDQYNSSYGSIVMAKRGYNTMDGWNFGIAGYGDLTNYVGALGVVTYSISGGNDPYSAGTTKLDTLKWHMITTVYSLSKQEIKIYVDGYLDQTTENMISPSATAAVPLYIGSDYVTSGYFLKGSLDDLRIYNRALTPKEVLALYVLPN
jgi:hypothetical protein